MKYLLVILSLASGTKAFACAPPPNKTYVQPSEYRAVLESPDVMTELRKSGGQDIAAVRYISGQYEVDATNGCFVRARVNYAVPTFNGTCPQIAGIEILASGCL